MPDPARPLPTPPKRRRERLGFFLLVVLACLGVVALLVGPELRDAYEIVGREDVARDALLTVRTREIEHQEQTGHYGFVRELAAAGRLADLEVVTTDGVAWVRTPGYRIDVLLPNARLGPGVIGITPDGPEARVDTELATRHVSVVARPIDPGVSGHRMWYVDQRGDLFLNEGVIDDLSAQRNELPVTQVTKNATLDTASLLLWQRASEVLLLDD